ncbi:CaiB/BaiF CoA transferase family protein [Halolamina salifodinae]|uniref:Crotonobetainyl-CoA:carnitine CoA-transferase CaiB-like acyl-CoA transferase n=1 Tax=Halolamina salifodinae TaxID=1202767 RepID=A0A8T4GYM9_9EURY|nr:crotonobetainyl-CoA:carnitine CoA-transferase CaiB-like acyl-CoA transferase [Halolamina salifodinae]
MTRHDDSSDDAEYGSDRRPRTDGGNRVAPDLLSGAEGRPLSDVTVLELGHIIAGPFCSMLLADLGAEVIKVEHPKGGDAVRDSSEVGNSSFNYVNRNKLGITLDLKSDEGNAVFEDLVEEADVLIENFAAGTADRLGVGYDDLKPVNEELVYCSIKGFNEGPYEDYPALDPVAEALSGVMSVTGHPGQPPVRCGTSLADMAASLYGAISVLGGVRQRDASGEGQHVTVPLYESTVSLMGYWLAYSQTAGEAAEPIGAGHPNWAPYNAYQSADGEWVFVGPSSQAQWEALCEALEADLHEDERFATLDDRREHREALDEGVGAACEQFEAEELIARLRDAGVPVAPVNDTQDVVDDPHLRQTDALGTIRATEGDGGDIDVPRYPARSTGFERVENTDPPELGEDTDAVLEALGYDAEERKRLREANAV